MKKICGALSAMLILMLMLIFPACSLIGKQTEELTEVEKASVGTWELKNITYIGATGVNGTRLQYPSSSETFNQMCEQYLYKTKIIFEGEKKKGKMSATFIVGESEKKFSWNGNGELRQITFSEFLQLSSYNGSTISRASTNSAIINITEGILYLNPTSKMIYTFKKTNG